MAEDKTKNTATTQMAQAKPQAAQPSATQTKGKKEYNVPQVVKEKYPDLVELIKQTESMNDDERDYWFQVLPIMTAEQIEKLKKILLNEKEQLSKLDKEYEAELGKLNEKHLIEWQEFEAQERRKRLRTAESKQEEEEKHNEEDLLSQLNQA